MAPFFLKTWENHVKSQQVIKYAMASR